MSAQEYSVPGQTERRKKAFLEWKSIDLSSKVPLTCGGNLNYFKSVHQFIPTRGNREHSGIFQNKSVSSFFNWVSRYILFLAKLKRRGRTFSEGARRGPHCEITPEHLVVIRDEKVTPFVQFEIILPLLFSLDPLTNKHCRTWGSMMNSWIDSRTYQK